MNLNDAAIRYSELQEGDRYCWFSDPGLYSPRTKGEGDNLHPHAWVIPLTGDTTPLEGVPDHVEFVKAVNTDFLVRYDESSSAQALPMCTRWKNQDGDFVYSDKYPQLVHWGRKHNPEALADEVQSIRAVTVPYSRLHDGARYALISDTHLPVPRRRLPTIDSLTPPEGLVGPVPGRVIPLGDTTPLHRVPERVLQVLTEDCKILTRSVSCEVPDCVTWTTETGEEWHVMPTTINQTMVHHIRATDDALTHAEPERKDDRLGAYREFVDYAVKQDPVLFGELADSLGISELSDRIEVTVTAVIHREKTPTEDDLRQWLYEEVPVPCGLAPGRGEIEVVSIEIVGGLPRRQAVS